MLRIRQIKRNYNKPIIDILNDLEPIIDKNNSNIIWWVKDNMWYIQQNDNKLWCHYYRFLLIVKSDYEMSYPEIETLTKKVIEEQFNLACVPSELKLDQKPYVNRIEKQFELNTIWHNLF